MRDTRPALAAVGIVIDDENRIGERRRHRAETRDIVQHG
jgi:hypothetical protein